MTITKEQLLADFKKKTDVRHLSRWSLEEVIDHFYPYINSKEEKCCEKCWGRVEDENGFGRDYGCLKDDCPCHILNNPTHKGALGHKESKLPSRIDLSPNTEFHKYVDSDEDWKLAEKINEIISYLARAEEKEWIGWKDQHGTKIDVDGDFPSPVQEWEKRLGGIVHRFIGEPSTKYAVFEYEELKSFITSLLEREREAGWKYVVHALEEGSANKKDFLSAITSKDKKS